MSSGCRLAASFLAASLLLFRPTYAENEKSALIAAERAGFERIVTAMRPKVVRTTYRVTDVQYFPMEGVGIEILAVDGAEVTFMDKSPDSQAYYYRNDVKTYNELKGELIELPDGSTVAGVKMEHDAELIETGNDYILHQRYGPGYRWELFSIGKHRTFNQYDSLGTLLVSKENDAVMARVPFDPFDFSLAVQKAFSWDAADCSIVQDGATRRIKHTNQKSRMQKTLEEVGAAPILREVTLPMPGQGRQSFFYEGSQEFGNLRFPTAMRKEIIDEDGKPKSKRLVENISIEEVGNEVWAAEVRKVAPQASVEQ